MTNDFLILTAQMDSVVGLTELTLAAICMMGAVMANVIRRGVAADERLSPTFVLIPMPRMPLVPDPQQTTLPPGFKRTQVVTPDSAICAINSPDASTGNITNGNVRSLSVDDDP